MGPEELHFEQVRRTAATAGPTAHLEADHVEKQIYRPVVRAVNFWHQGSGALLGLGRGLGKHHREITQAISVLTLDRTSLVCTF